MNKRVCGVDSLFSLLFWVYLMLQGLSDTAEHKHRKEQTHSCHKLRGMYVLQQLIWCHVVLIIHPLSLTINGYNQPTLKKIH